mmetsp:Transcript_8507/g.12106  ORF Transcript_8507/g.12106 Transcript_8507/m.12106 type:complete len:783 (-) Transcript_8507:16-2364(-)
MLNLWVCEPETQEDVADMGDMFCPDQIDKWDSYQTHEMYQQGTSPPQTDLLQEPQIDYSRHLHTVDTSANPFNGTQVRVVSTGGSVSDSKSKASVSGGHNTGSSSRNFYKRALQQHQNLLHASKSQTVQMCSEDLSDGMQNSVNIGASYNYGYPQGNNQHQVELNQYDSLSQQYDNQSHYSYNHFVSSHENIHYGPIPNCDVQQSNFFNPPLNETYKDYDYRLCSMQMKPVTPVAPVNTFNNQHQCQYNFNEYAASHPASSQHPINCNETPYEYSNYPQPQPNVAQPFQNIMMYNNGVGESHGTHAPLQNPLRLSVVPSPALQQQPFVSYNLDLQPKMVPAAVMPPCDFQATSDISHDSTVKEIQEKPKEEGTAPSQGTEDTAEDTSPTSFNEMYQNLCLFYKTYGHTNVPKMKGWYLLGSWVDSLRKRKKFQILKERGVNIASQERQLTYQEIRHLEDINFNWNTVTAKENEAIISVMKNIDKSKTTTPSVKASGESDLICATTSEDGLSLSFTPAGDGNPKDMNACKIEDVDNSNPQEKPLEPTPSLPTCSESSSKSVDKASKPKKTFANVVSMKNKRGTSEETVSDAKSKRKRTKRFKKNDLVSSKKSDKDPLSDDEDPQVTEQTWTSPFKRLVEFKRIHGNASVPARNLTDPKLGHWVMTQRRQYQLLQKGKPSRMTKERVDLLEGLGFQWSIRTNPVTMWKMRFEELVEYKELNGGCLVPQRYHENPQLGTWVNTQRRHFKLLQEEKRSCMTKERLEKLNAIGFSWSTSGKASSSST